MRFQFLRESFEKPDRPVSIFVRSEVQPNFLRRRVLYDFAIPTQRFMLAAFLHEDIFQIILVHDVILLVILRRQSIIEKLYIAIL